MTHTGVRMTLKNLIMRHKNHVLSGGIQRDTDSFLILISFFLLLMTGKKRNKNININTKGVSENAVVIKHVSFLAAGRRRAAG
jgi:hypothetical protein